MVADSLDSGGALKGALVWQWEGFGTAPRTDNGSNIRETDSTFMVSKLLCLLSHLQPCSCSMQAAGLT